MKILPFIMKKIFCILLCLFTACIVRAQSDLLITNARILDGTGNSWYWGSVEIEDGLIYKIHKGKTLPSVAAMKTLDAKGLILSPGFIDVHAHIESTISTMVSLPLSPANAETPLTISASSSARSTA